MIGFQFWFPPSIQLNYEKIGQSSPPINIFVFLNMVVEQTESNQQSHCDQIVAQMVSRYSVLLRDMITKIIVTCCAAIKWRWGESKSKVSSTYCEASNYGVLWWNSIIYTFYLVVFVLVYFDPNVAQIWHKNLHRIVTKLWPLFLGNAVDNSGAMWSAQASSPSPIIWTIFKKPYPGQGSLTIRPPDKEVSIES